jgi:hypothetical protein
MSVPTSDWLPAATPTSCPACGMPYVAPAAGRCGGCGVDLTVPCVEALAVLERRQAELTSERRRLLAELAATRVGATPATVVASGAPSPASPPLPVWARARTGADEPRPRRAQLGVPTLLALAGGSLLVTAAIVFSAVTWETLPASAQAAILIGATILAAGFALFLQRRELRIAAASVALVAMAFAAVDVVALQQGGLVDLGDHLVAAAAFVAAPVGWLFERRGLRWAAQAGAAALAVSAFALVAALAGGLDDPQGWLVPLVAAACAVVVAASRAAWRSSAAGWIVAVAALVLLLASGGVAALLILDVPEVTLAVGLLVAAVPVALLVVGARWTPFALIPAALVVTGVAAATAWHLDAAPEQTALTAGVAAGMLVWATVGLRRERRLAVAAGCIPALTGTAALATLAFAQTGERLSAVISGDPATAVDPWLAVSVPVVVAVALVVPRLREDLDWFVVVLLALVAGALPVAATWPLLLAVAAASAGLYGTRKPARLYGTRKPAVLRGDPVGALVLAVLAVGWAAGDPTSLAVAAAATAAIGGWYVAWTDPLRTRIALAVGMAAAGLAIGAALVAASVTFDLALGAGVAVVFSAAIAADRLGQDDPRVVGPSLAALATVVAAIAATGPSPAGVIVAGTTLGWVVLALVGSHHLRWVAAASASAGYLLLAVDHGVEPVELLAIVPAVALGAAGVWWLLEDHRVPTALALSPALLAALVPSLVVLADDPRVLARTLGLAVAAGLLAAIGVRLRWLAPTVAGALTAIVVASTQLAIVVDLVPRWATFATVGVVLVWLAATYERQQQRARSLKERLIAYR